MQVEMPAEIKKYQKTQKQSQKVRKQEQSGGADLEEVKIRGSPSKKSIAQSQTLKTSQSSSSLLDRQLHVERLMMFKKKADEKKEKMRED